MRRALLALALLLAASPASAISSYGAESGGGGASSLITVSSGLGSYNIDPPAGGLTLGDDPTEWPFYSMSKNGNVPLMKICDPQATDEGDGCIELEHNCQVVTAGSEDCNTVFYQRSNGTRQQMLTINGDELGDAIARTVFHSGVRFEHHIIIPNGSNPSLSGAEMGRMTVDTTENQLLIGDTTTDPIVLDERQQVDFRVEPPTARTYGWFKAHAAMTVAGIDCITDTGTATLSVQECDSTGASCSGLDGATEIVCDSNSQSDDGTLSNPSIDTGDWVKVTVSGIASAPTDLALTVRYRMTRK